MISVRLTKEYLQKINIVAKQENMTISDIIKAALKLYFIEYDKKQNPYHLGKDLFGKYGSKKGNLSSVYKRKVRHKIHEKVSN